MNTTLISIGLAAIVTIGLVVTLGALSLLSGAFHFLFARPKLEILKAGAGPFGFAFAFKWNSSREPAKFNRIKIRMFNPFGSPTQVEVTKEFDKASSTFSRDLDMGPGFESLKNAKGLRESLVMVELNSTDGLSHQFQFKGAKFLEKMNNATLEAEDFSKRFDGPSEKPLFNQPKRSFIADPFPASGKTLKIASNPAFAGDFAGVDVSSGEKAVENFAVKKVWIEDGCIVCDACEDIKPEVFSVKPDGCIIIANAPLDDGIHIAEAAEACPVEIIKFEKSV